MKKLVVTLVFILLVSTVCINNNKVKSEKSQGYVMHTVREGECLSLIAEKYKGKYERIANVITEIKVENGLVTDDIIAGRVLMIRRREK